MSSTSTESLPSAISATGEFIEPNKDNRLIDLAVGWPNHSLVPVRAISECTTAFLSQPPATGSSLSFVPDAGPPRLRKALAHWIECTYALSPFHQYHDLKNDSINNYRPQKPPMSEQDDGTAELRGRATRLCITGGASQALAILLAQFTHPAVTRAAWLVAPCYHQSCRIFADAGFGGSGRMRGVPEDEEGIDLGFLEREMRRCERGWDNKVVDLGWRPPSTKVYRHVVYCVPSFANPSGKVMSQRRRVDLVRLARKMDALIVADDVYDLIRWHDDPHSRLIDAADVLTSPPPRLVDVDAKLPGPAANGFGNTVSNGTVSKIVGPRLRTGWIEGTTDKIAQGFAGYGATQSGGCGSSFLAEVLAGLIEDGLLDQHARWLVFRLRERLRRFKKAMERYLVPLGVDFRAGGQEKAKSWVGGGYFVWVRLPVGLDSATVAQRANMDDRVVVAPGTWFEIWDDNKKEKLRFNDYLRLCFAWEDENSLEEGIKRLARTIKRMLEE